MFVTRPAAMDRRWRCSEGSEVAPSCPRCASPNTKFCYYNNYSRSQPRYLCKSCRRYWTKGGSLRNVPVGGGCRKSRRTRSDPPPPSRISPDPLASDSRSRSSAGPPPGVQAGGVINGQSPEIDLALVFSKFFNDNPVYDPELPGLDNPPTGPAGIESLNPAWQRDGLLEELPGVLVGEKTEFGDGRAHEVTGHDHPNTFGLPDVLGDEAAAAHHDHDILWSISGGRGYGNGNFTSNSTWEEEYDLFPSDDRLKISTHLMCDNWSAFDLSGL